MKRTVLFVALMILCLTASPLLAAEETASPDVTVMAVIDEVGMARINWTEDHVEGTGQGVPPTGKENTPQGKLLARRAATVDLQRNLLEFLQGVRVDSKTTMNDFMASDVVRTEVQGMIRNVEIVEASWDGEIYTVVGRVKLEKVRRAVLPVLPEKPTSQKVPAKPAPSVSKKRYTGLVIDARNLPLIPAMTFRILDGSGKEVYSLGFVDKERFLSSGLCDYHGNINFAKGAPRVADAPLVVRAVKMVGPHNVDIVISNTDAAKIRKSTYDFRIPCRVTVVKR